ncbi:MAG: HipA family kinase [Nocardioidaceae bacterium]
MIEHVTATRYVTPLREGGSLPGIVEADDLGTYVLKFSGAGQGLKVLVAEVIVGELARRLGIAVPELHAVQLDEVIAKYEADEEVQDLLTASVGLNLRVDFLPGAFGFDAASSPDPELAAKVLWLDAFVANVDRSWRNPNLLNWHGRMWCIDHGAALYFHHGCTEELGSAERFAAQPYDATDHVLSRFRKGVPAADEQLSPLITRDLLTDVVGCVPEDWIEPVGVADSDAVRAAYVEHLLARNTDDRPWLDGLMTTSGGRV